MAKQRTPRTIKRIDLQRILRKYKCRINPKRGKGSHATVERTLEDGTIGWDTLDDDSECLWGNVNSLRRKLRLSPRDGISDADFLKGRMPKPTATPKPAKSKKRAKAKKKGRKT